MRIGQLVFWIACLLGVFWTSPLVAGERFTVYTVNYPLQYFAERIGGEHVEVVFPAPPDVDPAYWMPNAETIIAYQRADLILCNGAGYAKWTSKVSLPRTRAVDTSIKIRDRFITSDTTITHSHGAEGKHAHENLAFTTWLDFPLAAEQARAIAEAFSQKRPELVDLFQRNFVSLEQDLLAVDRELKKIAAKNPSLPLVVSHPVYDYLASAYGLNIRSVHWEPDQVPGARQVDDLKKILKGHPAKWMIWEGVPEAESVAKLAELGVESLVFDPCGNAPDEGDYLKVMRSNIENLANAYK